MVTVMNRQIMENGEEHVTLTLPLLSYQKVWGACPLVWGRLPLGGQPEDSRLGAGTAREPCLRLNI